MHDPMAVAFEIRSPFKNKSGYSRPIVTIWHVDPEKDGTDDSCGRFIRDRHIPKSLMEKVKRDFLFEFKHHYWFNESGYPKFSTIATAVNMYHNAAWKLFMWMDNNKPTNRASRRLSRFMRNHTHEIIRFAENPVDSLHSSINMTYGVETDLEARSNNFASIVLADIMRKIRPWYKHPRWHVWHWHLQIHPIQQLKRRYWDKCSVCGKRGFKGNAMSDWDGTSIWHSECDRSAKPEPVQSV